MTPNLVKYVSQLDVAGTKREVDYLLSKDTKPEEIQRQMFLGLVEVGKKYELGEYFIGDLIVAGMLMKEILSLEKMKDNSDAQDHKPQGKVLMGTVSDDIHDIGKDIFKQLLVSNGFEVIDLGVDVSLSRFIEAIKKHKPDIVGLSCILTTAINHIFDTIKGIEDAGLRNDVKIIVGGAVVNKKYFTIDCADAFTNDAYEGLTICREMLKSKV